MEDGVAETAGDGAPAAADERSVLVRNIDAIRELSPWYADALLAATPRHDIVSTTGPMPAFAAIRGTGPVWLCAEHDPEREAEAWARRADQEHALFVVYGFGAGYGLRALDRRFQGSMTAFLCFEPDLGKMLVVLGMVDHSDWLSSSPMFFLHDPSDGGTIAKAMDGLGMLAAIGIGCLWSRWV